MTTATPKASHTPKLEFPNDNKDGQAVMMWLLQNAQAVHDFKVVINDKRLVFKYRKLLHEDINRIAAESWAYETFIDPKTKQEKGINRFDTGMYVSQCIKRMFMQEDLIELQPFPLTPQVVRAFPPEVGVEFEALIPNISSMTAAKKLEDLKNVFGGSQSTEE